MDIKEITENPVKYFKSLILDFVVIIVSGVYILYQMIELETTEINPLILIAQALMGIICGIIIKQAIGEKGFSKGYANKTWIDEENKYNDACNLANDYIDRVDKFYIDLEKEKRMNYRRTHLQAYRMKYDNWFDNDGNYIGTVEEYQKLTFRQKLILRKCTKIRIYILNLFSEYSNASEQDTKPEMTDKKQRNRTFNKNLLSAVLIAVVGVYFIPVLNSWSWANLIASSMQVSLWILFGIIQLYTNFNFVVQDKVATLRRKKELISRFIKNCEKGMYQENHKESEVLAKEPVMQLSPIVENNINNTEE